MKTQLMRHETLSAIVCVLITAATGYWFITVLTNQGNNMGSNSTFYCDGYRDAIAGQRYCPPDPYNNCKGTTDVFVQEYREGFQRARAELCKGAIPFPFTTDGNDLAQCLLLVPCIRALADLHCADQPKHCEDYANTHEWKRSAVQQGFYVARMPLLPL